MTCKSCVHRCYAVDKPDDSGKWLGCRAGQNWDIRDTEIVPSYTAPNGSVLHEGRVFWHVLGGGAVASNAQLIVHEDGCCICFEDETN